ncbi:two-component sensor histidine kinase [Bacteroidia bacterium]|nr:two-component sensor histidine kinase [Bacteroidia bacterium]GHV26096.1 two-component sensor histidine kinase [Bacteroidia bacterium]
MKLKNELFSRLSLCFLVITGIWSLVFYVIIIDEINDETDDYLENYAGQIIELTLAGSAVSHSGSANSGYVLQQVTEEYAAAHPHTQFLNEMIYIPEKEETEPVRTLRTIFNNPNGDYYELTMRTPTIEKEDLRESILYSIIFLYLAQLVVLLGVNLFIFKRAMTPLYNLLGWTKRYTIGKNTALPEISTRITEFKELYNAMEISIKRNEAVFEQQKQFISNASHELQTPLAVCKNRLELMSESETMEEKELSEIMKIQQSIEYMIKLNKTLLFLSKIENNQFIETKEIVFNDLIEKNAEDFKEAYRHRNSTFTLRQNGIFKITANETLATSIVVNLLKNAFTHIDENGRIVVEINCNAIVFSNTGENKSLDKNLIFNRFYQGKKKKENSTGLGLAIVYAACQYCRLAVRYDYTGGEHRFTVEH